MKKQQLKIALKAMLDTRLDLLCCLGPDDGRSHVEAIDKAAELMCLHWEAETEGAYEWYKAFTEAMDKEVLK